MDKIKNLLHSGSSKTDEKHTHDTATSGTTQQSHVGSNTTNTVGSGHDNSQTGFGSSHTNPTSSSTQHTGTTGAIRDELSGANKPSSTTGVYSGNTGLDHGRSSDSTAISGTGRDGLGATSTLPQRHAEHGHQHGTSHGNVQSGLSSGSLSTGSQGAPVTGHHNTYAANLLDPNLHGSSNLATEKESALTHHNAHVDTATGGGAEAADGDHPGQVKGRSIDVAAREAGVGGKHSHQTHLGEEGARSGIGGRQALADRSSSYTGTHDVSGHSHSHAGRDAALVGGAGTAAYGAEHHKQGSHVPAIAQHERNHYGNQAPPSGSDGPAPNTAGPHSKDWMNKIDPRVDAKHAATGSTGSHELNKHHSSGVANTSTDGHGHSSSSHHGSSGIDLKTGRGVSSTQDAALAAGNTSGIAGPATGTTHKSLAQDEYDNRHHIGGAPQYSHDQRHQQSHSGGRDTGLVGGTGVGASHLESKDAGPYGEAGVGSNLGSSNPGAYSSASTAGAPHHGHSAGHKSSNTPIYEQMSSPTSATSGQHHSTGRTTGSSAPTGSEAYSNLDPTVPRSGTSGLAGEGINTTSGGITGTTAHVPGTSGHGGNTGTSHGGNVNY